MGNEIKVLSDMTVGQLSYTYNLSTFPDNPAPRTIIVKDGMPYIYTELTAGSGFMTWVPLGVRYANYVHTQAVASSTWTVTHNFGTTDFIYFVYDSAHNIVMANNTIIDLNTIQIQLTVAMVGTVVMFSADQISAPIVNITGGGGGNVTADIENSFTATQTFLGNESAVATVITNTAEPVTYSDGVIGTTVTYDITTQSVMYYAGNATANWSMNFRGSAVASLDSILSVGQCVTAVLFAAQGTTAYYCPTVQVDGTIVNPKWLGGIAPTNGNTSGVDSYNYTIIKIATATFIVLASQSKFA